MSSLKEFLKQDIPQHSFNGSFKPNEYENDELHWHLVLEYSKGNINVLYSFVKEICNLSPKIIKEIQVNIDKDIITFSNLNASFFKKLEVEVQNRDDMSGIVNGEADIDNSTKEVKYLLIELNKNDYDEAELKDTIEHELVHIYQTIHRQRKKKSLIAARAASDKRFYDGYTNIEDLDNPEDRLKLIIYLFDPDECTSKIQDMLAKIDGRKLATLRQAFDIVSKEEHYQQMKYYYDNLEDFISGLADCYYRDIFPKWESLTKDQIISKLRKYIDKNWKTFLRNLSKACAEKSNRKIK